MYNKENTKKGFTLIELLIVIAIIGVLAATVVISLGNQTGKAKDGSVKSGVSSLRASAITAANVDGKAGQEICDQVYDKISADKSAWTWDKTPSTGMCDRNDLTGQNGNTTAGDKGALCCDAVGSDWVVWGALSTADGHGGNLTGSQAPSGTPSTKPNDVYCADSAGFLGEVDLRPNTSPTLDSSCS